MCTYNLLKCKNCQHIITRVEKCPAQSGSVQSSHLVPCETVINKRILTVRCKKCGKDFEVAIKHGTKTDAVMNQSSPTLSEGGDGCDEPEALAARQRKLEHVAQAESDVKILARPKVQDHADESELDASRQDDLPACLRVGHGILTSDQSQKTYPVAHLARQSPPVPMSMYKELMRSHTDSLIASHYSNPFDSHSSLQSIPGMALTVAGAPSSTLTSHWTSSKSPIPTAHTPRSQRIRPEPSDLPSKNSNAIYTSPSHASSALDIPSIVPPYTSSALPQITISPATPAPRPSALDTRPSLKGFPYYTTPDLLQTPRFGRSRSSATIRMQGRRSPHR